MVKDELLSNLKTDIEESFAHLIESVNVSDEKKIVLEAKEYLETHLGKDYSEEVLNGLNKGQELVKLVERSEEEKVKKIALAALDYLIDPWDIIPDFVANKGFLDDIYVFDLALERLDQVQKTNKELPRKDVSKDKDWVILKLGGASGPHLAKRAKQLNILNSYQRKALFDIGRKQLYGYDLSKKQFSFFETLIKSVVRDGVLDSKCPDSPCKYCNKLEKLYN